MPYPRQGPWPPSAAVEDRDFFSKLDLQVWANTQGVYNVKEYGALGDGATDDSAAVGSALAAAVAAGGGKLVFPESSGSYLLNGQVSASLDENVNVDVAAQGAASIRTSVAGALDFRGVEKLNTTLEAQAVEGTRTLTVASTAGIKPGDVLVPTIPLIAETTYHREMSETHAVARVVDATTVELGSPLEFRFYPQADVRWLGTGARTAFWYPSYFVPSGQIEVLVGGVVQGSGYALAARSSDSDRFGFDVTFAAAPANGVEVRIRNTQKIRVKAYRSGRLSVDGLRFSSASGTNYIRCFGMHSPRMSNVRFESDANTQAGDYSWFADCVNPIVRNVSVKHGRYAVMPQRCRDADVQNVVGHDAWHLVSVHGFSANTHVRGAWGHRAQAAVDSHPSFNLHMRDVFGLDDSTGVNNGGSGGSMVNVHAVATATVNAGFTNGVVWTQDGDLEGPYSYRPYMTDFHVERSSFKAPNQTGGFVLYANQANRVTLDRVVCDGPVGSSGTYADLGIKKLVLRNAEVASVAARRVSEKLVIFGGAVGQLVFAGSAATNPLITASHVTFSHPTAIIAGGDAAAAELGYRKFVACRFHDAANLVDGNSIDTGGTAKKKYTFVACIFDDIGAFDANLAANDAVYRDSEFVNGAPDQSAVSAPNRVTVYDTPGTFSWAKPPGCVSVEVVLQAGGGGGGSGRRGAAASVRAGGAGAGGGGRTHAHVPASVLGATEQVVVGAAGSGGAAATANDTNGNAGTAGGNSRLGSSNAPALALANGGAAGPGGTAAAATGGAFGGGQSLGSSGGSSSGTGGAGGQSASGMAPGGGAGGGLTTGDATSAGGFAGLAYGYVFANALGGTAGGGAGGNGTNAVTGSGAPGGGGGGGGSATAANGGAGGAGGNYGAGGGGGGAALNGFNSGAGGNGAPGFAIVIAHF